MSLLLGFTTGVLVGLAVLGDTSWRVHRILAAWRALYPDPSCATRGRRIGRPRLQVLR